MARLVDQFREALTAFAGAGTSPALIGGLALAAHQVIRAMLLRSGAGALDMDEVAGYFGLFEREALLEELITQSGTRPA